jgi:monofunctional biosynthetic peptidoglycan transglycosylase
MSKSSRGRRAVAEQLGLIDQYEQRANQTTRPAPARKGSSNGARKRASSGDGGGAPKRGKLPSDRTIAGAMIVRLIRWAIRLFAFFVLASIALVIVYRVIDPPLTPLMVIRPLEGIATVDLIGVNKKWVNIEEVSPALLRSLIAAEDGRFFTHNGVDWKAVDQAQKRNERSGGKKLYGASTITMQCARNVFLWQGRNYVRKALEMYFTYLIEFIWGKKRILEVYINVIEWGDGVYGVEAASEKYFGIPASQLNARQAALLASVLPNPRAWSPATPTAYINRRASMIQGRAGGVSLAPLDLAPKNSSSESKPKKSRKGQ